MELLEKINRTIGGWYEGLFGGSVDLRPKDILRKILVTLEENRKEGFDSKTYVPNHYVLEVAVEDDEERSFLFSFLDKAELEEVVRKYCKQNGYHLRGPLDFSITELEPDPAGPRREKVKVRCRYQAATTEPAPVATPFLGRIHQDEEMMTVASVNYNNYADEGTVPAVANATLIVNTPGIAAYEFALYKGVCTIGRSKQLGNEIVLPDDPTVSRKHARIELDRDGRYTVYDLDTTNGTRVNGSKVTNRTLNDGDEIKVGATIMTFRQSGATPYEPIARQPFDFAPDEIAPAPVPIDLEPQPVAAPAAEPIVADSPEPAISIGFKPTKIVLLNGEAVQEEFSLGSETVIGRGMTNDIVISDHSVGIRHIRILRGESWSMRCLETEHPTLLNGISIGYGVLVPIQGGDVIQLGEVKLRFEEGKK